MIAKITTAIPPSNPSPIFIWVIPFYITILVLAALAWMKAGRGTAIFTALGLLLIYGMGFWEATMQTLALVFSSTCLALIVGVPLGVWTANSPRAEKILRPVLDLMQTMPAFVYFFFILSGHFDD